MKKAPICLVMMLLNLNASAEWLLRGSDDSHSEYIDYSTVRKYSNKAKHWIMVDYAAPQRLVNDSYLSVKYQYEYDCKNESIRVLSFVFYSDNMGQGQVVVTDSTPSSWTPVIPGSGGEARWKMLCLKK